jgi:hypothetical protein
MCAMRQGLLGLKPVTAISSAAAAAVDRRAAIPGTRRLAWLDDPRVRRRGLWRRKGGGAVAAAVEEVGGGGGGGGLMGESGRGQA